MSIERDCEDDDNSVSPTITSHRRNIVLITIAIVLLAVLTTVLVETLYPSEGVIVSLSDDIMTQTQIGQHLL